MTKERPSWTVSLEVRRQQLEEYVKEKERISYDLKPLQERGYWELTEEEFLLRTKLELDLEVVRNLIKNVRKRIKEWETGSTYLTRQQSLKQSTGHRSHIAQQGV
jgi:hypothetical protein